MSGHGRTSHCWSFTRDEPNENFTSGVCYEMCVHNPDEYYQSLVNFYGFPPKNGDTPTV